MIIAWPMIIAWYGFMANMSHVARAAISGRLALASGTVRSVPPELWGTQSEGPETCKVHHNKIVMRMYRLLILSSHAKAQGF